ncbi:hypothetical protein BGZ49_003575 [Haplosporangium sp. Z 27]|nr:hypothetical protein BGZ49_003575 [Haplosporangium sp. Z 27]
MVVTRTRRTVSSAASRLEPTSRQSNLKQQSAAAADTTTITNPDNNNHEENNNNSNNNDNTSPEPARISKSTKSISIEQSNDIFLESLPSSSSLSSESKKATPLTARGTRGTRQRNEKSARRKSRRKSGFFSDNDGDNDDVDDVEEPRLQYLESVVIPEYSHTASEGGTDIFKEVAGRARRAQKDYKALFDASDNITTSTNTTDLLNDSPMQHVKSEQVEQSEQYKDNNSNPDSLLFSRLSLTPPPLMFELEEGFESAEAPWQMVFDSTETFNNYDPEPSIKITELTVSNQAPDQQEDRQLDDNFDDHEEQEQDDDPFGFTKVERKLERSKDSRSKLLAINEVHNRAFANTRASTAVSDSASSNGSYRSRNSILSNRLEQIVQDRNASRKRGDLRNKGKAVDRQISILANPDGTNKANDDDIDQKMDSDIQKAIQLSRGSDVASGEGCSSTDAHALSRAIPSDKANVTTQSDVADSSTAATRSSRRISRMYGKSTAVNNSQDTQTATKVANISADNDYSTTVSNNNNTDRSNDNNDIDDFIPTEMPSTPQRPTNEDTIMSESNLSMSSDDFLPILIEDSPKKKPEAGMPLSLESPSSKTKRNGRSGKYMLTEQLEALLPRRRRPMNKLSTMRRKKGTVVSRNIESNDESDSDLSSAPSSSEDNDEEELGHHRQKRKRPATVSALKQVSSKKRRTPVESSSKRTPTSLSKSNISTSATTSSSLDKSKGKEKEKENGGWSTSQIEAQKERIKYFQQVDDFELDVETC